MKSVLFVLAFMSVSAFANPPVVRVDPIQPPASLPPPIELPKKPAAVPAAIDVCKTHFECGVYTVTTHPTTKMTIVYTITTGASKVANQATFHFQMQPGLDENLVANFEPAYDKSGALLYSKITMANASTGELFASGLCSGKMCTFGLIPTPDPDDDTNTNGQVGLIRFAAGKMEFALMSGTPMQLTPNMQQTLSKPAAAKK